VVLESALSTNEEEARSTRRDGGNGLARRANAAEGSGDRALEARQAEAKDNYSKGSSGNGTSRSEMGKGEHLQLERGNDGDFDRLRTLLWRAGRVTLPLRLQPPWRPSRRWGKARYWPPGSAGDEGEDGQCPSKGGSYKKEAGRRPRSIEGLKEWAGRRAWAGSST